MAINFFEIFQNLGLTQSETKTYFASFQLGPSSIQDIAKRAKLSRTAVYDAVASLENRGILSTTTRGKKTIYTAEDPERVIAHFKSRVKDMEEQIGVLQSAQNELSLLGGGERPTVRFFEGEESVRALFSDVAVSGASVIREISDMDTVYASEFMPTFRKEREKHLKGKNIEMRIIHRGAVNAPPGSAVEWVAMPATLKQFKGDIWIYGNRVVFVTLAEKIIVVIIENVILADTMRTVYDNYASLLSAKK